MHFRKYPSPFLETHRVRQRVCLRNGQYRDVSMQNKAYGNLVNVTESINYEKTMTHISVSDVRKRLFYFPLCYAFFRYWMRTVLNKHHLTECLFTMYYQNRVRAVNYVTRFCYHILYELSWHFWFVSFFFIARCFKAGHDTLKQCFHTWEYFQDAQHIRWYHM